MIAILLYLGISTAWADNRAMYERTVKLIEDRYLRIEEFDPAEAFVRAAEAAESALPWLIVEPDGDGLLLTDAAFSVSVPIQFVDEGKTGELGDLPEALTRLESAIVGLGSEIDVDTELSVVLLKGVANSMDRHTVVLAKRRLAKFNERIKGKLTGIGAKLKAEDGFIRAEEVFEDTPAERGGLMIGDAIHRVDGVSTLGMSIQQAVDRIRGPKGTEVVLSIRRVNAEGESEERELVFTRDRVNIPNVTWKLMPDGVGIITIDNFSEHTSRLTLEALEFFRSSAQAGKDFSGIVLDLRGNAGGSLIQSAETADLFLSSGEIVQTAGRDGATVPNLVQSLSAHPAASPAEEPAVPLVVLQNTRSASASEIVSGALATLGRAVVLGRPSYGKGTVQKLYTIRSGPERVRLKLTVAEYKLSGGKPVHGEGVDPDLLMRRAIFRGSGAWYPRVEDVSVPVILEVDERDGWRTGHKSDLRADPLMKVARRIVLAAGGPTRADTLDAIERLSVGLKSNARDRLSETFLHREIDWQPTDEQPGILDAAVTLEVLGEPLSGQWVTVRAEVVNQGPAPLYQARVRMLSDDSRTPWHNTTIPVGFVPPGERAIGQVEVAVSVNTPDRSDDVVIRLEADQLDPVLLDPVSMGVTGVATPPMSATVRLLPHEDHHRIEVELENKGDLNLTGLQIRLGWQDDSGVELLNREASLPVLAAASTERVDFGIRLLETASAESIPISIRVWAERFQTVFRESIEIPRDGTDIRVSAPIINVAVPVRVQGPNASLDVNALDDGEISSLTVWWNGEKHAWLPGGEPELQASFDLPMDEGSNQLTVVIRDNDDRETRLRRYVWGEMASDGAAVQEESAE